MNMSINLNQPKPKVFIEPYLGCQKCNPRPYSARKWYCRIPYGRSTAFSTWEEAMKAANAYRAPVQMNSLLDNPGFIGTPPWLNRPFGLLYG